MKIILATWNSIKVDWLTRGFSALNLEISPVDKDKTKDVEEKGTTIAENALIKVRAVGVIA